MRGQLGRAVKAIDSKSIGVTRVSSSLTAVDVTRPRSLQYAAAVVSADVVSHSTATQPRQRSHCILYNRERA